MAERLLSGNDYTVRLSKQTLKGAIDSNPVFDIVRRVDGKARENTTYVQSSEVKSNRQARSNVEDSVDYPSEISFEFTEQTLPYLQDTIQGTEVTDTTTETTVAADADGFTDSGVAVWANLVVGDYFFIEGFSNALIDGAYKILVKNTDGDVETSPVPVATEAASASITTTSNITRSASVIPYYTIQTAVVDEAATGDVDYQTFFDTWFNTASFEVGETGIVTGSLAMVSEQKVAGNLLISGQSDNAADTSTPLSAINNIVKIWVDGVDSGCTVKSMGFEFSNNLQEDKAAACEGSLYANSDITLSGSLAARLHIDDSQQWRDRYNAGTNVALAIEITHSSTKSTIIEIGRAVITEHEIADGSNVVANSEMTYTAEEDSRGYTTSIYRNWT